jgi:hypothetical protein
MHVRGLWRATLITDKEERQAAHSEDNGHWSRLAQNGRTITMTTITAISTVGNSFAKR